MSAGDIAWVLTSCALVLFMTPGLALFYGGMVRAKNVLNMLMMNFFTISIVTVLWVVVGYTLVFGDSVGGIIGDFSHFGLSGVEGEDLLNAAFQLTFAIITPALITGAVAERMKFSAWVAFAALWALLVYPFVGHWTWGDGGWFHSLLGVGAADFAGGLVVHINAGIAALVLVKVLGIRRGFGREAIRPHSLPLTLLGTGILWFGWFGFNAGSAFAADGVAINAWMTTQIGASLGALGWVAAEWRKTGQPTTLGAASGAVAGLVAITPAAGYVGPLAAIAFGLAAGVVCFAAVSLKYRFEYDDSLDVVGVHLVGGIVGSLLLGILGEEVFLGDGVRGLIYGGGDFFAAQVIAILATLAFSGIVSYGIAKFVDAVIGLRADDHEEIEGLDISLHEERGYVLSEIS
jgi:Amt family ammonium transporter